MFSKKYEYRPDNPGVQENLERIRQRMVANIAPAHTRPRIVEEGTAEYETGEWGEPATIALEQQSYGSADENLNAASSACRQIAEDHLEADLQGGLASLSKAVRNSLKWYTGPSERYWETLTVGLNHVVASLKAHDAVLQIHADAINGSQKSYSELVGQLQGVQATKLSRFASQSEGDTEETH